MRWSMSIPRMTWIDMVMIQMEKATATSQKQMSPFHENAPDLK